jgi:hypothetical protein
MTLKNTVLSLPLSVAVANATILPQRLPAKLASR